MTAKKPHTAEWMQDVLRQALDRPLDFELDEEIESMVASGNIADLSPEDREKVVRAIACDDVTAAAVASTYQAIAQDRQAKPAETKPLTGHWARNPVLFRITPALMAMAACVCFAIGAGVFSPGAPTDYPPPIGSQNGIESISPPGERFGTNKKTGAYAIGAALLVGAGTIVGVGLMRWRRQVIEAKTKP